MPRHIVKSKAALRKNKRKRDFFWLFAQFALSLQAKYSKHEKENTDNGHRMAMPDNDINHGTDEDYQPAYH